ncbi:hypothetical protein [Sphingomicrobium aestuariivivum]|uniref:hypothetical protein n=1 Tax=Sphingomicrobium aestuariivivum TaxID=1582356 RepID=UPI001FD71827|nr:hypothetical protein [Sphingomicrobium aestuariivivum]MCJ8190279.1 hypothetical protein [Sphingomicrobium aestuariivivum]
MMITVLSAAALATATPTFPATSVDTVVVEGQKITYKAHKDERGRTIYAGKTADGEKFNFTVRKNGLVTGKIARQSVSFKLPNK